MQLTTSLNYGGNCEAAFKFYEQHPGGKIQYVMRHGEMPGGSPASTLTIDSIADTERTYQTLSDGGEIFMPIGEIFMPIAETFFAHRFAMLRHRFGTSWMLLQPKPQGT